ncbi:sensor histidine kinase [Algihabitans albus]|uniref:sensor histidine kinase n=1 Tax=Algihabitans albus TaxID=2164067 RepID=UPI000E5CC08D|nr:HAMP domain-containing sensor histidine kinase [Algihabitans albus]
MRKPFDKVLWSPDLKMNLPGLAILLGGLALTLVGLLLGDALHETDQAIKERKDSLFWAVSQVEYEFDRLRIAGFELENSGEAADFEELALRQEIFVNRVRLLDTGIYSGQLAQQPDHAAILVEVERVIEQADKIIAEAPQVGVRETAGRLLQTLGPLAPALRQMTVKASQRYYAMQEGHQKHLQRLLQMIAAVFLLLSAGVIAFVFLIMWQHRRLRHSNTSLVRLSERLHEANLTKDRFLASMSHELRTPLNAILGFSEIMRDQHLGTLSERYRSYAEDIHYSAAHLLQLINDILDLSKLEAGRRELDLTYLSVGDELTHIARLLTTEARKRGVTLVCVPKLALPPVFADRLALRQVLLNLIGNALKFSSAGDSVEVTAIQDANGLTVSVIDQGVGIDSDDLDWVLQPFEQVRSNMTAVAQGTGLGLPLSKGLVELHGGHLWIESAPGIGTTVSFTIPLSIEVSMPTACKERLSA